MHGYLDSMEPCTPCSCGERGSATTTALATRDEPPENQRSISEKHLRKHVGMQQNRVTHATLLYASASALQGEGLDAPLIASQSALGLNLASRTTSRCPGGATLSELFFVFPL